MSYPKELELTLSLKLTVSTQEEEEYFLSAIGNSEAGLEFIADVFDALDYIEKHIKTINSLSQSEVQKKLQESNPF